VGHGRPARSGRSKSSRNHDRCEHWSAFSQRELAMVVVEELVVDTR